VGGWAGLGEQGVDTVMCRYQPVLQMFSVLHFCDFIVRFTPNKIDAGYKDGSKAVRFGMEVLVQSRAGFPVAGTLQELLKRTALRRIGHVFSRLFLVFGR
jgi:hypothetical protein